MASASRLRGGLAVCRDVKSRRAASETSSTARSKAASLAREGCVKPLSLRTNCSADARISSSVAGGSKLKRVLTFRHMRLALEQKLEPAPKHALAVEWHVLRVHHVGQPLVFHHLGVDAVAMGA